MGQAQLGSLTSSPAQLVAASDSTAELKLVLGKNAAPGTKVRFDTFGLGSVTDVKEPSPGVFTATLHAPKERYPQVLIVRADVGDGASRGNVWAAVPVLGVQTVKITTKPNAQVDVVVGSVHFPSSKPADSTGRVDVAIQVPPGVEVARVRSTDRLGNKTDKPLPLDPPEFVRVRAAPVGRDAAASWADEQPLPLELFGVQRDGSALAASTSVVVELDGKEDGSVEAPKSLGPGLWRSQYKAPSKVGDGKAVVRARLKEKGAPLSKPSALELRVLPGPPVSIAVSSDKPVVRPDDPTATITAVASDAQGNEIGPAESVQADFGTLTPENGKFALSIPLEIGARKTVNVTARSGSVTQTFALALKPGLPSAGVIVFAGRRVRAGDEPLKGTVRLKDARGNPVAGAELQFASDHGKGELVRELGEGLYEVQFLADNASAAGETALKVTVADAPLELSQPLVILPGIRPGSVSVGAFAGGRSNLSRLSGGSLALEGAVYPTRLPLELTLGLTYARFAESTVPVSPGVELTGRFQTIQFLLGGRYSFPLAAFTSLYAGGAVGTQRVNPNVSLAVANLNADSGVWSTIGRVAFGLTQKLGPGRFAVELGYGLERFLWRPADDSSATTADPRVANLPPVTGNLGGVQLSVGYLFQIR